MKRFGRKKEFTTTRIIAVGFFVAIVIGTFLLMLPLSSKTGKVTGIVDALFTSTTSVCVTGLVTVPTYAHWSLFGQVVIALLAQVGGLGVITFTTMFMLILRRRIGNEQRLSQRGWHGLPLERIVPAGPGPGGCRHRLL